MQRRSAWLDQISYDEVANGDLDRLPMLTWIMFLNFLDDLELQCDDEAMLREMRDAAGNSGEVVKRAASDYVEPPAFILTADRIDFTNLLIANSDAIRTAKKPAQGLAWNEHSMGIGSGGPKPHPWDI